MQNLTLEKLEIEVNELAKDSNSNDDEIQIKYAEYEDGLEDKEKLNEKLKQRSHHIQARIYLMHLRESAKIITLLKWGILRSI